MAGSQLKNLKKSLKEQGFTGQTNVKGSKKGSKRQAKEYDREEKAQRIAKIREQFNPFELKVNRDKKTTQTGKNASLKAVGKPGISKQIGEERRLVAHEAHQRRKNRLGGLTDRRFGERNKNLTEEEKMLERFTRERQAQSSSKKSLFNLEDDDEGDDFGAAGDEDLYGGTLTHYGQSLALEDDFQDDDLGLEQSKRSASAFDGDEDDESRPAKKKTKAEVMKEVIAKSKFYKHERQKAQEKLVEDIEDVDEEFDDIMSELSTISKQKPKLPAESGASDKQYDTKVRELGLERRAVPADRTKTQEEIDQENAEKREKLEQARIDRMNGMAGIDVDEDRGVEDLGDDFWEGDNSEEEEEFGEHIDNGFAMDDVQLPGDKGEKGRSSGSKAVAILACPQSQDELMDILENHSAKDHPSLVKEIIRTYQPRLAAGNKELLGTFVGVLLRHILYVSNDYNDSNAKELGKMQNELIAILRSMAQKYNEPLSLTCREISNEIQTRFKTQRSHGLLASDLVFFTLVGYIFSTSDHYHLVATPSNVLMGELLEQTKLNTFQNIAFCAVLARISLTYQRLAKRFVPELVYFFEKSLTTLLPISEASKLEKGLTKVICDTNDLKAPPKITAKSMEKSTLSLRLISDQKRQVSDSDKIALLCNIFTSMEEAITQIWKDMSCFPELAVTVKPILMAYCEQYPNLETLRVIVEKIERFEAFSEHFPLALQNHRPLSIPMHTPKFEENFNPDKKSNDPDRTRNEVNKVKAQLKKERKFTMKEIRKDTKFEARQQIDQKKKEYSDYHAKMARIVNQISTEEGAEKGKYEREKRLRNSKK
ncbi:LAME_0B06634g1_1 [Lachancea meyersii CBS 8951]|uniref:LAME_0B06634g1_1 n=1 Tax=Lachancea meyersii CBS 8951 TaxID=1266667 RepID=A0A1G4IW50_9SACH|nr:LAME_0B06634g1_1 [Lachancea meyersii CBS 8951]